MWYGEEFRSGKTVKEKDGRHEGELKSFENGRWIVKWANGWLSEIEADELERV